MIKRSHPLLEILALALVLPILVLLLPWRCPTSRPRVTHCANNLKQIYVLAHVYHRTTGHWPPAGEEFWRALRRTSPPLPEEEDLELLRCPVLESGEEGTCDYLISRVPLVELRPGDPVAGDKPGNHGTGGGNLLLKDGSVVECLPDDPRLRRLSP